MPHILLLDTGPVTCYFGSPYGEICTDDGYQCGTVQADFVFDNGEVTGTKVCVNLEYPDNVISCFEQDYAGMKCEYSLDGVACGGEIFYPAPSEDADSCCLFDCSALPFGNQGNSCDPDTYAFSFLESFFGNLDDGSGGGGGTGFDYIDQYCSGSFDVFYCDCSAISEQGLYRIVVLCLSCSRTEIYSAMLVFTLLVRHYRNWPSRVRVL